MIPVLTQYHKTPFGEIILGSYQDELVLCDWRYRKMRKNVDLRITKSLNTAFEKGSSEIIDRTIIQLEEYFNGKR